MSQKINDMDKSINIIIIEDDKPTLKNLCGALKEQGFDHLLCGINGEKAWEAIQTGKFDLVITDWNLPGISGLKLLQKIRTGEEKYKDIPVIMITADDATPNIFAAKRWNVNAYLIKPVDGDVLAAKIIEIFTT